MMFGEAIQEGARSARARDIDDPVEGREIAQASIHESVLKQVEKGLL
jgi:hypothetical protein